MQTAVDMSSHVITSIEAHLADRRDSECLAQILQNTIKNLKQHDLHVEEIACATGYSSSKALQTCVENKIIAYIPNFGQYKPFTEGFTYDKEADRYTCTAKAVPCLIRKPMGTRKVTTENSIVVRPKIVAVALYALLVLAERLITKR